MSDTLGVPEKKPKRRTVIKAEFQGHILALSDQTIVIEGYQYFPARSVNHKYLKDSETQTTCKWKGLSFYKHLVVDGTVVHDAAWYYPEPKPAAQEIKGYFAFWRGVRVGPI